MTQIKLDREHKRIWRFFASIKLSVFLLIALAATSIIGTLIPQNEQMPLYFEKYGGVLSRLFGALNLFDMYHSRWFQFLILMLAVNIIVCSLDRISGVWKIVFVRTPSFDVEKFRKSSSKKEFVTQHAPPAMMQAYVKAGLQGFGYRRTEKTQKGFVLFGETGRWSRLGVYGVHFSVILLLAGGLIGSLFGFDGYMTIPEGEAVSEVRLRKSGQVKPLDFAVHCDDFKVTFYDTGAPKEYKSSLTLQRDGQVLTRKEIIVNDPLRFAGINFFQSSYGMLDPQKVTFTITSQTSGMTYTNELKKGAAMDLPENLGNFRFEDFRSAYMFKGHSLGPVIIGKHTPPGGEFQFLMIPLHYPGFDKMRGADFYISVADYEERFYTGLQVTKDPGIWVVYSAFILMIASFYVTFFRSHQRLCIEVVQEETCCRVMVAGWANRNRLSLENRLSRIARRLELTGNKPAAA